MDAGRVVLLERAQRAAGASVRTHYDNPLEAEIAFKSFRTFQHWDEVVGGGCGFVNNGYLALVEPGNAEKLRLNVKIMQDSGINTRVLTQRRRAVSYAIAWPR